MSPKKKAKSKKLAKMSEEDRLRYLQHKATMEEEAHRRKQQIIATYMNIKLKHEELFTRLNSAKINQQWRHILRTMKCEKLREDISNLQQHYEDILTHKNELISRLLSDFDRAEFQYSFQFQEHMETISKFLKLHGERLQSLHSWYTKQLNDLRNKNVVSTRTILESVEKDFENIESKRNEAKSEHGKKLQNAESTYLDRKNDLQTKLLFKSVKEEEKYADKLAHLQKEYNAILEQYKSNTDGKLAHYKILSQKDNADMADITRYHQTIQCNVKRIENKKDNLESSRENFQAKENDLNSHKIEIAKELQSLRQQYEQNCKIDRSQLKLLVNSSNSIFKDLDNCKKEGDRILHLMSLCDKLEKKDEIEDICREKVDESCNNVFTTLHKRLNTFWKVWNSAKVANGILLKTRLHAQDENDKLRKLLFYHVSSFRQGQSASRKYGS